MSKKKLVDEEKKLEGDLSEANKVQEQLLMQQAQRQNPLREVEWPLTYQNEQGNTLLHKAVSENNIGMLELFLRQSGQASFSKEVLNIQNEKGKTPVDIALESQNLPIINLLMTPEYPIDSKRWQSIVNSNPELLSQFAQTHDIETYTRHHVDFMAESQRKFWMDVVKNSANPGTGFLLNAQDTNGNTLLHAAVHSRDLQDVNWLLSNGADKELENKQEYTAIDLMKNENESDRKQKSAEKNQAYVGMSVYGGLFIGGVAMLAAAIIIGSTPIGWALGIAAVVVGLLSAPAFIEKLLNFPGTSSPFPVIPVQKTEKLTVDTSLLPHLGEKAKSSSKLSAQPLQLTDIDKDFYGYLGKNNIPAREIEVLPGTKALIGKLNLRKNGEAKKIVYDVKGFQALQIGFKAFQQNLNKFVGFKKFLTEIKKVAPDMLQEIDDKNIDSVLKYQIFEGNQIREKMEEAARLLYQAVDHLMKYEFKQFEEEFAKFKQFMDENNLVDEIKQVDEKQIRENELLGEQVLNVKRELAKDVVEDIKHFESLKREFAVCKNKQDFFNSHLPSNDEVQNVNKKINDQEGPARLIMLGEIARDNIKQYLQTGNPALVAELVRFQKIRALLEPKVKEIAKAQQPLDANAYLMLMRTIQHFEQVKKDFDSCKNKQQDFQNTLAKKENKDSNIIAELGEINKQIELLEQSIAVAETAKENPEEFERISNENFRALIERLENDVQQIITMQEAIVVKAEPVVEEKPPQPEPTQEAPTQEAPVHSSFGFVISQLDKTFQEAKAEVSQKAEELAGEFQELKTQAKQKVLEAKKEFQEKRKEAEKPNLRTIEQEPGQTRGHLSAFRAMRQKAQEEKRLDEQAAQKESRETTTHKARGNGLR